MKRDARELVSKLVYATSEANDLGKLDEVYDMAKVKLGKYIKPTKVKQIFTHSLPINTLDVYDLYYISLLVNDCKLLDIELSEYFTDTEISEAMSREVSTGKEYDVVLELENVLSIGTDLDQQWVTTVTNQKLAEMYSNQVFNYNFATQRKAKIEKYKGKVIPVASIDMNNVEDIKKAVLKEKLFPSTVTLNIRANDKENYIYNEKEKKLVIYLDSTEIDETDGYHRTLGIYRAWKQNPDIKGHMIVNITHFTVKDARSFILQTALGNFNNGIDAALYDSDGVVSKIISEINKNNDQDNILHDGIMMGNSGENALIYYDTFATVLNNVWGEILEDAGKMKILDIAEFICDTYSVIYANVMEKFKVDSIKELNGTVALDQMLMAGWLYVARKMYIVNEGRMTRNTRETIWKIVDKVDLITNSEKNKFSYNDDTNHYELQEYDKAWKGLF